jgi:hypothetical protein
MEGRGLSKSAAFWFDAVRQGEGSR